MFQRKPKKPLPDTPQVYPSGVCVRTEKGWYYIKGTKRFRLVSDRVVSSWGFPRVYDTTEKALAKYPVAGRLGFRDGSLIQNITNGTMYIVADNRRRPVVSPDVLDLLGIDRFSFMVVSKEEIELQKEGEPV